MRPASGTRNPEISANKVVLPAPFGPTSAPKVPGCTARLTRSTARSPPNAIDTPSSASSGSATALPPQVAHAAADAGESVRREQHDQHQHDAVYDHVEAGQLAEQV